MFEKKFLMPLLCLAVALSLSATATRGANILFVSSMTAVEDDALKAFMEGLGHTVTYIDDDEDEATTEVAAAAADLVFISESCGSGGIKNEITEIEVPMIVGEPWAWDEMGLTEGDGGDDPAVTTDAEIVDPGHYMAAGLSGTVAILTDILEGGNLGKGITGPEATVIATATLSDTVTYDVIFVYEKGAALPVAPADGSAQVAADIRIGFGFHAVCYPVLSENAYALLGAAVDYALGLTGPPEPVNPGSPDLLAWWTCDEGAGTVVGDTSGNGHDGTFVNGDPAWVEGIHGSAVELVAPTLIEIPPLDVVLTEATMAGWIKPNGAQPDWSSFIMHRAPSLASGFNILGFQLAYHWNDDSASWSYRGGDMIAEDDWTFAAVTIESDKATFYVNGVPGSVNAISHAPSTWDGNIYLGGDSTYETGRRMNGALDDVSFFSRALTANEILDAMEGVEQVDMQIGFAAQPPVIDGEVDGIWADASTQYFVPLDDPANASGSWTALYDSENLYVIVDMTDDSLQNDSASSWQDDSVEVYFDGGNTKVNTPLSGDDHQYTFGWTTDDIQGTNIDGATEGMEHAQVTTDTGWRIEIKMPWLSIQGAAPKARDLIGIDCYYNDDDDGGDSRENKLLSFSTVEGWNDASQWGTAMLIADKRVDVTAPGDAIQGVPNDGLQDGSGNFGWPGAETPDLAIDDDTATKYLHFKGELEPTGFQVTPLDGATIVTGLTLTTANDAAERDPVAFELSGSNEGIDGPYELIASGDIVDFALADAWPRFTMNATPISFDNDVAYAHYQVLFPAVRDAASANSMQIAEVELLGVPAPPGPVGHWKLDDGEGAIAVDSSGNGLDGILMGDPQWATGIIGGALDFDGDGDYVDCGNDASLDITGPISIALWIRPDADDPEGQATTTAPMAKAMAGMSPSWSYQVRYGWGSPQPYMAFTFNSSPRAWAYVGKNLERYEWCHIACSHDGTTLKCYLNGEETDSTPMGAITSSETPVLIGSDGWACDWIGAIDEVRIYNRDLSDGEIRYLAGVSGDTVENLLQNPSFEEDELILDDPDWEKWTTWNPDEGAGSNTTIVDTEAIDGTRSLRVEPIGAENWHFILLQDYIPLEVGKNYTATFWAKAEAARPLGAQMKATDNSISWGYADFELTTEWAEYTMTSEALNAEAKLELFCAGVEVPFWLDLVSVYEGD